MIIYNITVKVDAVIADAWKEWQMREHIPEIMQTGLFEQYHFCRLLNQDDEDGPTYVTQFFATRLENYEAYIRDFAPVLRDKAINAWGKGFIAFRSLLEVVK